MTGSRDDTSFEQEANELNTLVPVFISIKIGQGLYSAGFTNVDRWRVQSRSNLKGSGIIQDEVPSVAHEKYNYSLKILIGQAHLLKDLTSKSELR